MYVSNQVYNKGIVPQCPDGSLIVRVPKLWITKYMYLFYGSPFICNNCTQCS